MSGRRARPGERALRIGAVALAMALGAGCGSELRSRLAGVRTVIAEARQSGAYQCAPRELAMAESHADFTEDELDYGNYVRAREELAVADAQSRLALERSPRDRCAPSAPKARVLDTDGDGIPDATDKCPLEAEDYDGFQDDDGCPEVDNDNDGVLDMDDKCPNQPEDRDDFQDDDGCPDPDNDKDGVLDPADRCPNEPGPVENGGCPDKDRDGDGVVDRLDKCPDTPGPADNDGCPRYKLITVTKEKIELKEKVHFTTDSYRILPDSFTMLNEVADVLMKNPQLEVRIEGHTDSRASLRHNMVLSQNRANSVRQYLIRRGVDAARMYSVGYGPKRPVDDNRTAAGRENNRRVEFIITRQ